MVSDTEEKQLPNSQNYFQNSQNLQKQLQFKIKGYKNLFIHAVYLYVVRSIFSKKKSFDSNVLTTETNLAA